MNTIKTKANHYQELIKRVGKGNGMNQILVTYDTTMKMQIQKPTSEIQEERKE